MNLDRLKQLLFGKPRDFDARELLLEVLHSSIELLSLEDNDFTWSRWKDQAEAVNEMRSVLSVVEAGDLPDRLKVTVLFAPTGPIQEVSLSSGWGETFLKVAEKFDRAEQELWS